MKLWEQFHPFVFPDVMGAPIPVVDRALMLASREFCTNTGIWREWSDPVTVNGTTQRFDFDFPSYSELVGTLRASVDGEHIRVLGAQFLPADWQLPTTTFNEKALIHISMSEYMLYPMPSAGQAVSVELSLQPSMNAPGVADDLFLNWVEELSSGALYRLQSSPSKPYTDLAAAARSKAAFDRGIHFAANERFRQSATADRRVKKARI